MDERLTHNLNKLLGAFCLSNRSLDEKEEEVEATIMLLFSSGEFSCSSCTLSWILLLLLLLMWLLDGEEIKEARLAVRMSFTSVGRNIGLRGKWNLLMRRQGGEEEEEEDDDEDEDEDGDDEDGRQGELLVSCSEVEEEEEEEEAG